ncbi:unnamed protein product [Gongylonema pulchrum]|uniref:Uncharacterized protein n=1 Tax=Gongylonema pulchrum TaxID=637853 RepID=A0A183CYZ2_9BILA|nr:unnamed protein product [Gongylonema pulchrum]
MNDVGAHNGECDATLLRELSVLLERCAISDPFIKVYIKREAPQLLKPAMFLMLLAATSKFNVPKKADSTDISAFCAGFACILLQFNAIHEFFVLCGTYVSTVILTTRGAAKQPSIMPAARFIAHYSSLPPNV